LPCYGTILLLMAILLAPFCAAAKDDQGRIAIIDTSRNVRDHLPELKAAGVKVIGRYYGRCPQWEGKRLIDNGLPGEPGSEIDAILDNGFAVLSIYQYLSSSKYKFQGKSLSRKGTLFTLKDANCSRAANPPHSAKAEAALDAAAAVAQAQAVGQPPNTAIYFGVDFNFDRSDTATAKKMIEYFTVVQRRLNDAGYLVGAYGSGDSLMLLKEHGLIDFTWLSASRAYAGSSQFHNSGQWNLFQNWTETTWFRQRTGAKCVGGLDLDTDVQNAAFAGRSIGFWTREGPYAVPKARTEAVYKQRRFACNGNALIRAKGELPPGPLASTDHCGRPYKVCEPGLGRGLAAQICYANTARIGDDNGVLVRVDYDDDGAFDGWTRIDNLSRSFSAKPVYIKDQAARRNAICP
jgi:hypothetical protein